MCVLVGIGVLVVVLLRRRIGRVGIRGGLRLVVLGSWRCGRSC